MNKLTTAVWEITMGCNMRCNIAVQVVQKRYPMS